MKTTAKRATVHDVFQIAMDLERRAMELYTAFATHHAKEPELRQFWLSMARHEAGHYGTLALVESLIHNDPDLETGAKVWFEDAIVVRLKALLGAYLREAKKSVSPERALEMAIDIEGSELEDVVVDLLKLVQDGPWREQAGQFLIHDLSDLSYMIEKFTRDPKLLARADALVNARVEAHVASGATPRPIRARPRRRKP